MNLETLKKLNPEIEFYSVDDNEFATFGRVVKDYDASTIIDAAKKIANPAEGSSYVPSEPTFEALDAAKVMQDKLYGQVPCQVGYCWGHNTMMNATEWHTGSEINIAITDIVLILGHVWDVKDNKIDASMFKAFYVPAGYTLEVYATSLHFCPCQTSDDGFGCVVGLPKDTNTALVDSKESKLLWAKNKWLLAHTKNEGLVARGAVAGITGTNFEIKY